MAPAPRLCLSVRQGERGTSLRKLTPHRMPKWEVGELLELLVAASSTRPPASVLVVSDNAHLVDQVVNGAL